MGNHGAIGILSVLMGLLSIAAAPGPIEDSPRRQYEILVKEYDVAAMPTNEAGAREGRLKGSFKPTQPQDIAPRFFALAENHPDDPAAIDSLIWIASRCVFGPESEKALVILAREYSGSEKLKDYCEQSSYGEPFWPYEEFLRAVLKGNTHREVRARACLALAVYLKMAKETTESHLIRISLRLKNEMLPRGPESLANLNRMKERGLDKVAAESAARFEEVIGRYADIRLENSFPENAGELAKGQLFELRNLGIGAHSPEIEGKDVFGKTMKLSDYRGKVVVLDFGSHRSCGACRQYYPHLRQFVERFQGEPVALLGINVDDDVEELRELTRKREITWPLWWDGEEMEGPIAAQWVINSMPTLYVLDHKGVIRNKGHLQPDQISGTVNMLLREMYGVKPK